MSTRKCLLVGDGGTGKTSLMKRLVTGEFSTAYSATVGYEVHQLTIRPLTASSCGFALHVWDVSGQSTSGSLLEEILSGADCAIILFDVTSRITFNNVWIWYRDVVHVCGPEIPVVVLGNKIDVPGRKMKTGSLPRRFPTSVKYYDVSVKLKHNIEEPFRWLVGQLMKKLQSEIIIEPLRESNDPEISNRELVDRSEHENESQNSHPQEAVKRNVKKNIEGKRGRPAGRKLRSGMNTSDRRND